MKTKWLAIGINITAVILLILTSLSNVVGYQTVESSYQQIINEGINQRELVFQIIVDIVNNKEIQRIILKSQMSRGIFPNPDVKFSLTKNQLRQMYFIGLLLSKFISKSRIQTMVQQYQFINPMIQKEISAVIEKNPVLNEELTQLSHTKCDCENENTNPRNFTIICNILYYIQFPIIILEYIFFHFPIISLITDGIIIIFWRTAIELNCEWAYFPSP